MIEEVTQRATCHVDNTTAGEVEKEGTYLIAPMSATFLDTYTANEVDGLKLESVWVYRRHLNLDDLDFGDDGVWPTLKRVIGRRGLGVWRVTRDCGGSEAEKSAKIDI